MGKMRAATLCLCLGLPGCLPITAALWSQLSDRAKEPVTCATKDECDAAWQKAIEWVSQRCAFRIQTQTETLVETEGPQPWPSNDVACRLDRVSTGAGATQLEITARCGNYFGCVPEPLYLRAAFHDEMRAAITAARTPAVPKAGEGPDSPHATERP
jgi:hypothetical protein